MSYKITIKYDAEAVEVKEADGRQVPSICDIFTPGGCAANMFPEDSPYNTNTTGDVGMGTSIEDYMAQQVTHPGLIAAVRKAVRDGEYTFETDVPMMDAFMEEAGDCLEPFGITITVGDADTVTD